MAFLPMIAAALSAAAAGHALSRRSQNKDRRRSERKQRESDAGSSSGEYKGKSGRVRSNKHNQKEIDRYLKDTRKSSKEYKKAVDEYNKDRKGFMKKYGGEKFAQHPALNKGQQKLLDKYLKKSGKFQKLPQVQNYGEVPGLESSPLYQRSSNSLSNILQNPEQGYGEFREPMLREFFQEIAPEIAARYGGQRSSGLQNRLASAGRDLGSKLGALRAGLSRESQQFAIPQAANQAQQEYANRANDKQRKFVNEQQLYANKFGENQFNAGLGQLGLGTNPYVNIYRPPTFITNTPTQGSVAQPNFSQYQPSNRESGFASNAGGSFLTSAASGVGNVVGSAGATALTNKFGDWFGGGGGGGGGGSRSWVPPTNVSPSNVAYGPGGRAPFPTFGSGYGRGMGSLPGRVT